MFIQGGTQAWEPSGKQGHCLHEKPPRLGRGLLCHGDFSTMWMLPSTHPFCSPKLNTDGHGSIWLFKTTTARRSEITASFPHQMHLLAWGFRGRPNVHVVRRDGMGTHPGVSCSLAQGLRLCKLRAELKGVLPRWHLSASASTAAVVQEKKREGSALSLSHYKSQ